MMMSPYDQFVAAVAMSNQNIVYTFCGAVGLVAGYCSLAWWPPKAQHAARVVYLIFCLVVFVLFYFSDFE